MARVCHLNTCPVGVTSQKENLRKKFPGTPEHVVNFFEFVAEEVRQLMAHLGYSKFEDLIGRADLLKESKEQKDRVVKSRGVELNPFFSGIPNSSSDRSFLKANVDGNLVEKGKLRLPTEQMDFEFGAMKPLGESMTIAFLTEQPLNFYNMTTDGRGSSGEILSVLAPLSGRAIRSIGVVARNRNTIFYAGKLFTKVIGRQSQTKQ